MPRGRRFAPGGLVYHVLNRANAGVKIFGGDRDYLLFEGALRETLSLIPMRLLAYEILPNHWHLLLWPYGDGDLGRFMLRLTTTHARRWHLDHDTVGCGHVYQDTYKSFPCECDDHCLRVGRYVERNAQTANLVIRAEDWPWCSLAVRLGLRPPGTMPLSSWPVELPENWVELVNEVMTQRELEAIRASIRRGRPYGSKAWRETTARRLGLEATLRPRGRPRKR